MNVRLLIKCFRLKILVFFLGVVFGVQAFEVSNLPPKITLSVPVETAVEGRDMPLYITILCSPQDKIDSTSFSLNDSPFVVFPLQEEKVAPQSLFSPHDDGSIIVSRFRGMLPGRKPGLYTVGPISISVNGVRYESSVITVNVQGAVTSKLLRLEAKIESPLKIFPGQEFSLCYKIHFSKPIQLIREDLPFLTVNGLLNIGSPVVTTDVNEGENVQSIVQRVRAISPGTFSTAQSVIEGMVIDSSGGEKRLIPPLIRSVVEGQDIVVSPFPEKGRPAGFDGTIGSFIWRASSLDGENVQIGQPVRIEYRVSGRGEFSSVKFPSFDRLIGLQKSFLTESLPPVGEDIDGTKRFILVVRPKRLGVLEVPGFSVYSIDPVSERYLTETVSPVSLKVEGSKEKEIVVIGKETGVTLFPPYDIVRADELQISTFLVGCTCIFLLMLGFFELMLHERLREKKAEVTSQKIFYEAVSHRSEGYPGLKLFKKAFFLRLWELKMTEKVEENVDALKDEGVEGEVKGFLRSIDEALYRKDIAAVSFEGLYKEATQLYQKLRD